MGILKKLFSTKRKIKEHDNKIKKINNRIGFAIDEYAKRYTILRDKIDNLEVELSKLDELKEKVKKQEWIISHNKKFDINYLYNEIAKLVEAEVDIGYIVINKYLMEYYNDQLKNLVENDKVKLHKEYITLEIVDKRIQFNFGKKSIKVYLIENLDNDYNFKIIGAENKKGIKKGFGSTYG